ncbi:MAG: PhnB protein [Myxococcaceae bacterium]|nr:PhnB protein [Myxococcaceae bacterium]
MPNSKYMFIYPDRLRPGAAAGQPPSPKEMQTILASWQAWKAKFKDHIVDLGDALKPGGKVLEAGIVTDGPYPEAKEVVGGYSLIAAESYEQALEIARECPIASLPNARIEIRELAGYG